MSQLKPTIEMSPVINSLSALALVIEQMEQIRGTIILSVYKKQIINSLNLALGAPLPITENIFFREASKISETPGTMYNVTHVFKKKNPHQINSVEETKAPTLKFI